MHQHKIVNGVCTECRAVDPRRNITPRPDHRFDGLSTSDIPRMLLTFLIVALIDALVIAGLLWFVISHS